MRTVEYGKRSSKTIMLLHGGGLSWWSFKREAELLGERFHVVLPILDGHAGSDTDFVGIEESSKRITAYLDREHGGSVSLLGGLSLGAQIVLEMLSEREGVCQFAVIESASAIPSRLTNALIGPSFSWSYGLVHQKWFAKMQSEYLHIGEDLFDDYYRDTRRISRQNMISFLRASTSYEPNKGARYDWVKARIIVGGKERKMMLRSAELLHGLMPKSTLEIKKGLHHGEYSIRQPNLYADELVSVLSS